MATSIGMMDPAYFVGRKEILEWLNGYLGLNIAKVEETCSGAVSCQLLDSLFPGKVPMSKVNWDARSSSEYINNYKVLQSAFDRLKIEKNIDVQRLTRGKYMDNLEFMQWFKNFHDTTGAADGYDAVERRGRGKGGAKYGASAAGQRKPSRAASSSSSTSTSRQPSRSSTAPRTSRPAAAVVSTASGGSSTSRPRPLAARPPAGPDPQLVEALAKVEDLSQERDELVVTMAAVEKERDFYFDKLRDIELLFQNHEQEFGDSDLTKNAFKILYATDEDNVDGDGEVDGGVDGGVDGDGNGVHEGLDGGVGQALDGDEAQGYAVQALAGDSEDLLADDQGL